MIDERWKHLLPLLREREPIAQGEMCSAYYDYVFGTLLKWARWANSAAGAPVPDPELRDLVNELTGEAFARALAVQARAPLVAGRPPRDEARGWPENLRYGTPAENAADRHRGGTQAHGEEHSMAKLTEADVIEIRRLHASTAHLSLRDPDRWSNTRLGDRYGVDNITISEIVRDKKWRHSAA